MTTSAPVAPATAPAPAPSSPRTLLAVAGGLVVLLTLLVSAFTWPPSELEPRSLPIVVVGDDETGAQVVAGLEAAAGEDAFDVEFVPGRAEAVAAIEDRDAYGALLPAEGELLVASAAGPTVAQLLTQVARASQPAVTVTDVVPTPDDDPRGMAFTAAALPLVLGGIATGVLTSMVLTRTRDRVAGAALVAGAGGLVLTGLVQGWLGALEGGYLANSGVVALGIAAVALTIIGLRHVLGRPGIAVGALLMLLVGNPLSAVSSAPELIPLGFLGQLLPPGAFGSALRSTAFFDGAAVTAPLLVLAAWIAGGLLLALTPVRTER
ncbi:MAG TPA: hypothetical protein VD864_04805 [Nocardioides sp.]|nr:hypothetical protein [Nocardioides sp.]